jgi:serine/threonine-protein kinase
LDRIPRDNQKQLPPPDSPRDPIRIGPYTLLGRVDSIQPAEIYYADSSDPESRGQRFVIKVARRERKDFERLRQTFLEDASAGGMVRHPNVTAFLDLLEDDGGLYLVLEYVRGPTIASLNKVIRDRAQALSFDLTAFIAFEILGGLHYIHTMHGEDGRRMGLVVRYLTPRTVLIAPDGQVKLAGEALARVLLKPRRPEHPGERFQHSPIEWIAGEPLTPCSNVYTVGVMMFELLMGRACFYGSTVEEVMAQISSRGVRMEELTRSGVPEELASIVQRATHLVPEHRYASALDMGIAIAQWLKGQEAKGLPQILVRFVAAHGLLDGAQEAQLPVILEPVESVEDSFGMRKPLGRTSTIPSR